TKPSAKSRSNAARSRFTRAVAQASSSCSNARVSASCAVRMRHTTRSNARIRSLPQNFDDDPFLALSVPLAIKDPLPRPKVELSRRDRHDDLMPDGEAPQMCGGVVFAGLVVPVPRRIPRRDRPFEPLQDVFPESGLMVIHENRRRDVHGTNQHETFTHLANLHFLHNLFSYVDDLLTPLRVEPEIVGARLHQSPVSNCHSQTDSLNWPPIW